MRVEKIRRRFELLSPYLKPVYREKLRKLTELVSRGLSIYTASKLVGINVPRAHAFLHGRIDDATMLEIVKRLQKGEGTREVASELGVNYWLVRSLSPLIDREWRKEEYSCEKLIDLLRGGKSIAEIAERTGVEPLKIKQCVRYYCGSLRDTVKSFIDSVLSTGEIPDTDKSVCTTYVFAEHKDLVRALSTLVNECILNMRELRGEKIRKHVLRNQNVIIVNVVPRHRGVIVRGVRGVYLIYWVPKCYGKVVEWLSKHVVGVKGGEPSIVLKAFLRDSGFPEWAINEIVQKLRMHFVKQVA